MWLARNSFDAGIASHINLLPLHTLFLHSDLAGQNDTLGPQGESTIMRKIVLDQPQGSMVHDRYSQLFGDYVTLQRGNVHTMTFWLTDFEGREIETEFMNFSFSLIFVDLAEI